MRRYIIVLEFTDRCMVVIVLAYFEERSIILCLLFGTSVDYWPLTAK